MNANDVRDALRRACDKAGGQNAWADANEIARGYISDVLNEKQEPAGKLLDALGIERVVSYRRVK